MQETRTPTFAGALSWLELTYSSLRVDAYAVFVVITLVVMLLCAGAYQEAVRQAHTALNMAAPQDPSMLEIVDLVNQYGLAVLVGLCYFSNATDKGTRRELVIDAVSIAVGVLLPQLVIHATSVWTLQEVIAANSLTVNAGAVAALNMEWVVIWAISMALIGLAIYTWRFVQRPARARH